MALNPGARLGAYEIVAAIGSGGMGEVYRARDTNLGRDVAVKVLPEAFTLDADRIARFQREAQVLASLNHPNIAQIYGVEEAGGVRALILELVEGETLEQRLRAREPAVPRAAHPAPERESVRSSARSSEVEPPRGGGAPRELELDEALSIARQLASALEAAHEQGIIHRDLKPANIKLRRDGTVKVLDFGLAKALEPVSAVSMSATASPTLTTPAMTRMGVILGTAAYMSPEQARGKPVDRRADIWAFGVVLFEMLTGDRAFDGETISDVLARVIEREPDWTRLPSATPVRLRELVRRCLRKDPNARLRDIGDARVQIEELLSGAPEEATGPGSVVASKPTGGRRVRLAGFAAAIVASAAATAAVTWVITRRTPVARPQTTRFAIVQAATPGSVAGGVLQFAVSPDDRNVVYVTFAAPGGTQLMLRPLDQLDAVPLRGTVGARAPFFSPDGKWVGFFTDRELKKVSLAGGPAITLCHVTGPPRGASWGADDSIVFGTGDRSTGLLSVPAGGGEPTVLTRPDDAQGEGDHISPSMLPGGTAVLFTVLLKAGNAQQVAVLDLKTGRRKTLIRSGSNGEYIDSGHLVYADAGTLLAAHFDLSRLEIVSDPVPVIERVLTVLGTPAFTVSRRGTLIYASGGVGVAGAGTPRSLLWVGRQGQEAPIKLPVRTYTYPRLSPDGTKVAIDIRDQEADIWIADLVRQTLTRLTFDPANDFYPVWTPDGRRIIFHSTRAGAGDVFWQPADGTGAVERLTVTTNGPHYPYSIPPDGKALVYQDIQPNTGSNLSLLFLDAPSVSTEAPKLQTAHLIHTTSSEANAEVSPDGRWIAYQSNESGDDEIYVRPFPKVDGGRWQICVGGGTRPLWARSGQELFYLDAGGFLTSVAVETTRGFAASSPSRILDTRYFSGFGGSGQAVAGRTYDVSLDGKRFLMIKDNGAGDPTAAGTSMIVVLNWGEELLARVPMK